MVYMGIYRILFGFKKGNLTHATAGMDLEDPMLSKISQSQKRQILYDSTYMSYQK